MGKSCTTREEQRFQSNLHVALLVFELLRFVALLDLLPTLPLELFGD
jgi:hypothetical protein